MGAVGGDDLCELPLPGVILVESSRWDTAKGPLQSAAKKMRVRVGETARFHGSGHGDNCENSRDCLFGCRWLRQRPWSAWEPNIEQAAWSIGTSCLCEDVYVEGVFSR